MPSNFFKHILKTSIALIVSAVSAVTSLSAQSAGISIAWDSNSESDIAGYKVYYGSKSRLYGHSVNVGLSTEYTFKDLTGMTDTYIVITAYDSSGNESGYSSELFIGMEQASKQFSLGDAYPNPFNPETRIPYFLPSEMDIDIRVFDILGRQIAVLRKGVQPAGENTVLWDGTSGAGRAVANGAYFIRLRVGHFSTTKRVLFIK